MILNTLKIAIPVISIVLFNVSHADESLSINQDNVSWSKLKYYASAFFMSAETEISYRTVSEGLLNIENGKLLPPAQEDMLRIDSNTDGLGKNTSYQLWINRNGRALQRRKVVKGEEIKIYRFADCGYYSYRKKFNENNFDAGYDDWEKGKGKLKSFPASMCNGGAISEVNALLYLISAMGFKNVGDQYTLPVVSSGDLVQVVIKAVEKTKIHVDYRLKSATGKKSDVDRKLEVLKLTISPVGKSKNFKFLGLRGKISIYLDTENNLIMRISGKVKIIGQLDINLKRAYLTK